MQNSKASKMFNSQPLGCVVCSNYIDYNLIILIFKGNVLINFEPPAPVPIFLHCGDPSPSRGDVLNGIVQRMNIMGPGTEPQVSEHDWDDGSDVLTEKGREERYM